LFSSSDFWLNSKATKPVQEVALITFDTILPKQQVLREVPFSEATLWREQRAGRFPPFEQLSPRRVGVRLSHLNEWLNGRRDWKETA
jgi:prophage regulatory protein